MPAAADEQITLKELLEDPVYKAWMQKIPAPRMLPEHVLRWRVWVQRERGGGWARREFRKYSEAFNFLAHNLKKFHDAALCDKIYEHKPPVVRRAGKKEYHKPGRPGQHPSHEWCSHCRRPTIFTWYSRHHNFRGRTINDSERRCAICGIRLVAIKRF